MSGHFKVVNDTPGEREWYGFEAYEWPYALSMFLTLLSEHRQVSLVYVGEEFEEE